MRPIARADGPAVPGLIDTLSAGFQLLNRAPWVVGIPVLLDLLLWLGPRLSVATLATRLLDRLSATFTQMAGAAAGGTSEAQLKQVQDLIAQLRADVGALNLLWLLGANQLMASTAGLPGRGLAGTIELTSGAAVLLVALLALLAGVLIGSAWLGAIGQVVRDGRVDPVRLALDAPRYWGRICLFFLMLIGGALALSLPLMFVAAVVQLVVPGLGMLLQFMLALALQLLLLWSLVYLAFFAEAIVMSDVGPYQAAKNSVRVVSSSFWASLGYIIITWLIMSGMGVVWGSLPTVLGPWPGSMAAILGNGYIGSGLAAAGLLFYRDRFARLQGPSAGLANTRQS